MPQAHRIARHLCPSWKFESLCQKEWWSKMIKRPVTLCQPSILRVDTAEFQIGPSVGCSCPVGNQHTEDQHWIWRLMGVELEAALVTCAGRNEKFPGHKWNAVAIRSCENCVIVVWSIGLFLVAKLLIEDLPRDWCNEENHTKAVEKNQRKKKKTEKHTWPSVRRFIRCKLEMTNFATDSCYMSYWDVWHPSNCGPSPATCRHHNHVASPFFASQLPKKVTSMDMEYMEYYGILWNIWNM